MANWTPALLALIGVALGAGASPLTQIVLQRKQNRAASQAALDSRIAAQEERKEARREARLQILQDRLIVVSTQLAQVIEMSLGIAGRRVTLKQVDRDHVLSVAISTLEKERPVLQTEPCANEVNSCLDRLFDAYEGFRLTYMQVANSPSPDTDERGAERRTALDLMVISAREGQDAIQRIRDF